MHNTHRLISLIVVMELLKDKSFRAWWYTRTAARQDAIKNQIENAIARAYGTTTPPAS